MTGGIARVVPTVRGVPGADRPSARAVLGTIVALLGVCAAVALASRADRGLEVAGLTLALVGVLMSIRWPILPLFAIAILIPFEEAFTIGGGLGTLSRYAEVIFLLVYGIPRLGRLHVRALPIPAWAFAIWAALSAYWALDPTVAWTQITPLALLVIVASLIASAVVERPAIVRPLLWTYSLSAAAAAGLALVSAAISGGLGAESRVAGLADQDPALFAAILVPALVFGFYQLLHSDWVVPSAAIVLLSAIAITISGTRSAWFAVIVVFALFVIPRLELRRRIAAVAVVVAVIVIVTLIPGVADLIGTRANTAISTGGAGRTDIWTIGLAIFAASPWLGVGIANFPVANTPERARDAPLPITSGEGLANFAPHNIYVGTLGELGVVGLVLLATFVLPLILRRGRSLDGVIVQSALASLLVIGVFLDLLNRKEFWFFVGLAAGLTYLARYGPVLENEPPLWRNLWASIRARRSRSNPRRAAGPPVSG